MPMIDRLTMTVEYNVPASMRDGVTLYADVYRPATEELLPVVLMRHPYSKQRTPMFREVDVRRVVNSGYIVVMQDLRGRYTSEGQFSEWMHEVEDGVDSVEWAAQLPGCNGDVGMWGSSYAAAAQWHALIGGAQSLKSVVPVNSPGHTNFNGFLGRGGVKEFGNRVSWWHRAISFGEMGRAHPDEDVAQNFAQFASNQQMIDSGAVYWLRPFMKEVAEQMGDVYAKGMNVLVDGRASDAHRSGNTAGEYDRFKVPSFHAGGWFDCFLGDTIAQYTGMKDSAIAKGLRSPHLLIGPWPHHASDYRYGDLIFTLEARAALPMQDAPFTEQIIRWFDATLKEDEAALEGVPPVRLYLMGSNTWVGFDSYPPDDCTPVTWYFADNSRLTRDVQTRQSDVRYDYDPGDPAPTLGGPLLMAPEFPGGPKKQNELYDRADIISFTSDPLDDPLHIVGNIMAQLHVVTDAVDTDFVVGLCDVQPNGDSILLANGVVRLSARHSFTQDGVFVLDRESESVAGQDIDVSISLLDTAYTFQPGHRIRVDVTSSNFPRWDANPNTGSTLFDSDRTVVAHQTVRLGGATPSSISLPVVSEGTISAATLNISQKTDISNAWED